MERYTFRVVEGPHDRGADSVELESLDAARQQVGRFAASLLAEDPDLIWNGDLQVQVSNEAGFILFTVISVGIKSPVIG